MGRKVTGNNSGLAYLGVGPTTPAQTVVMDREPTVNDWQGYNLGDWWIVKYNYSPSNGLPSSKVFVLTGSAQTSQGASRQAIWKHLVGNTSPSDAGLVFLDQASTNNTAVPFLSLSGTYFSQYTQFLINLNNIAPSSDINGQLNMYLSTDGGSTFIVAGTPAEGRCGLIAFNYLSGAMTTLTATPDGTGCPIISNLNSLYTGGGSGQIYMTFGGDVVNQRYYPHHNGLSFGSPSSINSGVSSMFGGLWTNNLIPINYIKFQFDNSPVDIGDGIISIYGYVQS